MSISPLGGVTGQLWRQILKGNQRLRTVFNWHFCSSTHRLWVISCFPRFLYKPEAYLTLLLYHAPLMSYKLFSLLFNFKPTFFISLYGKIGSDVMPICPRHRVAGQILMTDYERQSTTSYWWIIDTFFLSCTAYEILAVLTDFCLNRKRRNVDFAARGRHRSNMTAYSERQSTTSYCV